MPEIKCPMCGKPNPDDLDACQFCEARLKPVTDELSRSQPPIHVGDEPTKKDTAELEPVLPKWLRDVRQQSRESTEGGSEGTEPVRAEEEPVAEEPGEDLLAGLQSQPEDEEIVPDWLAGLRGSEGGDSTQYVSDDISAATPQEKQTEGSGLDPVEQLPGWVSDLGESSDGASPDSLGDWLAGEVSKQKTEPGEEPREEGGLDFWVSGDADAGLFSDIEQGEEAIQTDGDIPAWLKTDAPDSSSEAEASKTAPLEQPALQEEKPVFGEEEKPLSSMEDELPDWLASFGDDEGESPASQVPERNGKEEDLSFHTRQEEVGEADTSNKGILAEAPPVSVSEDETLDWLTAMGKQEEEPLLEKEEPTALSGDEPVVEPSPPAEQIDETEPTAAAAEVAPFTVAGLPAENTDDSAAAFHGSEDAEVSAGDVDAIFSMEMPEWLSEVESSSATPKSTLDSAPEPGQSDLRPAELPSWVQAMRPVEAFISRGDQAGAGQPAEDKGPLAGLRGVLPLVPGVGPSSKPKTYSIKLQASEDQVTSAEMLEQLLEGEAHPKPIVTQSVLLQQRFLRMGIFAILLLVVSLSLLSGTQIIPIPLNVSAETGQALNIVRDELIPDSSVLIIFDYQAAFASELEAVAAPLVDHMILLKHPRLTLLASNPSGAGLSERFMRTTQPGQSFVNLGYLPGDAAGALAFVENPKSAKPVYIDGQNAWETPALQGISGISDFSAILLITNEVETAKMWIEQTQGKRDGTRLLVISSAQAGPLLWPYVESGQIDGMVTGLDGSGPIEQVNSGRPGTVRHYWDAYAFALLVTIFVISIGSLWSLFVGWQARRKPLING
jgi:hypothetical protein